MPPSTPPLARKFASRPFGAGAPGAREAPSLSASDLPGGLGVRGSLPVARLLVSAGRPGRPAAPRPPAEAAKDPELGALGAAAGPTGSCSLQPAGAGAGGGGSEPQLPGGPRGGGDARGRRRRGLREGVPASEQRATGQPPAVLPGRLGLGSPRNADGGRVHIGPRAAHVVERLRRPRRASHHAAGRGLGAKQRAPGREGAGPLVQVGARTLAPRRPPRTALERVEQGVATLPAPRGQSRCGAELAATPPAKGRDPRRKRVGRAQALRGAAQGRDAARCHGDGGLPSDSFEVLGFKNQSNASPWLCSPRN